jgi:hypothetical protein
MVNYRMAGEIPDRTRVKFHENVEYNKGYYDGHSNITI